MRKPQYRIALILALALGGLAGCQTTPIDGADPAVVARQKAQAQPAPTWMVGSFVGKHISAPIQDVALTVDATGRLKGDFSGIVATGQYIGSNRVLWSHGSEVIVERRPDGFRLVQTRNPGNAIDYTRKP